MNGRLDSVSGECSLRVWPALLALGLATGVGITPAPAQEIVRRVGRVTFRVDTSQAFPAGWSWSGSAREDASVPPGRYSTAARRVLLGAGRAPRTRAGGHLHRGGSRTLGVGIAARGGEQRVSIPSRSRRGTTGHCTSPCRRSSERVSADPSGPRRPASPGRASHRIAEAGPGVLRPPVGATGRGFGEPRTYAGAADVESRIDALHGERHRGIDYALPVGTPVRAPGAGTVLFAGPLALSGETVVIDHGQGVLSVLQHLSRVDARPGDPVPPPRSWASRQHRPRLRADAGSGASTSTAWPWTRR